MRFISDVIVLPLSFIALIFAFGVGACITVATTCVEAKEISKHAPGVKTPSVHVEFDIKSYPELQTGVQMPP